MWVRSLVADRYAKSVSGNVPEPEHPPQKSPRKRIGNVPLVLRFRSRPRRSETHWKRIENAPGHRREKQGYAKKRFQCVSEGKRRNALEKFPETLSETH